MPTTPTNYNVPVTDGFDAPSAYYADPDVAALARVAACRIPGAFAELMHEACDGDYDTARAVVHLALLDAEADTLARGTALADTLTPGVAR